MTHVIEKMESNWMTVRMLQKDKSSFLHAQSYLSLERMIYLFFIIFLRMIYNITLSLQVALADLNPDLGR